MGGVACRRQKTHFIKKKENPKKPELSAQLRSSCHSNRLTLPVWTAAKTSDRNVTGQLPGKKQAEWETLCFHQLRPPLAALRLPQHTEHLKFCGYFQIRHGVQIHTGGFSWVFPAPFAVSPGVNPERTARDVIATASPLRAAAGGTNPVSVENSPFKDNYCRLSFIRR